MKKKKLSRKGTNFCEEPVEVVHHLTGMPPRWALQALGDTEVSPRWTGGGLSITAKAATPMTLTWVKEQKNGCMDFAKPTQ